jgi:sec-independent protein translocase protein TatC
MPACARWLLALGSPFKAQLTLQSAFQFESRMIIGAGLVFEMPAIIVLLARFGIVTPGLLIRHFRLAVLVIAIVAAVVTPSGDALTMAIFAGPMVGLYLLGAGVAWLVAPKARA